MPTTHMRTLLLFIAIAAGISMGLTPETSYMSYVSRHGTAPVDYLTARAADQRIIMIGTRHRDPDIHGLIIAALPGLVQQAGINTLFMEIPSDQQAAIDAFSEGHGAISRIKVWKILNSPSYSAILLTARDLGIRIIATDKPENIAGNRDEWMSGEICDYLKHNPAAKGVVIAGARHVMKNIRWTAGSDSSLADRLNLQDSFSVVIWPDATASTAVGIDTTNQAFTGIKDPTLLAMNIHPDCSLATTTDGVILLPRKNQLKNHVSSLNLERRPL